MNSLANKKKSPLKRFNQVSRERWQGKKEKAVVENRPVQRGKFTEREDH